MTLLLGQLYDALRTGNVPDDKAEGEIGKLRLEMGGLRLEVGEVTSDVRLLKWMTGFVIARVLGVFALQWPILSRLPS